jgi:hypothetical protein
VVVIGFGAGLAMPTAMNAALGALTAERSGVGSGALQALRMVGGSLGAAVLGSVLNSGYRGRLDISQVPVAARDSVAAGVAVAERAHSAPLLHLVQSAFVHGMNLLLVVSACIAAVGIPLALRFMPVRAGGERKRSVGAPLTQ